MITNAFSTHLGLLSLVIIRCVWDGRIASAYKISWDEVSDIHFIYIKKKWLEAPSPIYDQ
jgi:hypothetical protein